jgi:hypothetical protein
MRPNSPGSREPEVMETEGESDLFDPLRSNRHWLPSRGKCKVGAVHELAATEPNAGGTGFSEGNAPIFFLKDTTEPQNNLVFTADKCSTAGHGSQAV